MRQRESTTLHRLSRGVEAHPVQGRQEHLAQGARADAPAAASAEEQHHRVGQAGCDVRGLAGTAQGGAQRVGELGTAKPLGRTGAGAHMDRP